MTVWLLLAAALLPREWVVCWQPHGCMQSNTAACQLNAWSHAAFQGHCDQAALMGCYCRPHPTALVDHPRGLLPATAGRSLTSGAINSFWFWFSGPKGQQKGAKAWSCTWYGDSLTLNLQKTSVVFVFWAPDALRPTTMTLSHIVGCLSMFLAREHSRWPTAGKGVQAPEATAVVNLVGCCPHAL